MHRFFVPPDALKEGEVVLRGELAHQVRDVLRLRPGEEIVTLDNTGAAFRVQLESVGRDTARGRVVERVEVGSEPRTRIVLYQALVKADKFEWVLQKGTEAGVAGFVPVRTRRAVADHVGASKRTRWRRILKEAAEQAGRARIPTLGEVLSLSAALEQARAGGGLRLVPYEGEKRRSLRAVLTPPPERVSLLIGPEGGLEEAEVAEAEAHGFLPVTLGPRILRTETAGLAAAAAILFACGDME